MATLAWRPVWSVATWIFYTYRGERRDARTSWLLACLLTMSLLMTIGFAVALMAPAWQRQVSLLVLLAIASIVIVELVYRWLRVAGIDDATMTTVLLVHLAVILPACLWALVRQWVSRVKSRSNVRALRQDTAY